MRAPYPRVQSQGRLGESYRGGSHVRHVPMYLGVRASRAASLAHAASQANPCGTVDQCDNAGGVRDDTTAAFFIRAIPTSRRILAPSGYTEIGEG
jgi:hypothetical protein